MDVRIPQREYHLTRAEASKYLGVSIPTMARWASKGVGPDYYLIGGKARYRIADLETWIAAHCVSHTSQRRTSNEQ